MIKNLKNKKKKGFTLIELIIVIAIIAVLAAIAVPQFGKIRQKSNVSADIANAKTIHSAVATAIANEEIILPGKKTAYTLNSVGTSAYDITKDIDGKIKPKALQQKQFIVVINELGDVSIYAGTGTSTGTLIYPQVETGTPNATNPYLGK